MSAAASWRVTVRLFRGGRQVWTLVASSATDAGDRARELLWQGREPIGTVQQIVPA